MMPEQREDAIPAELSPISAEPTAEEGGSEPSKRAPFRLGDRPALTGIRAVGVSLVLIFHSNFQTLPGSWVALGVFFVLSGFLITTMLATEHQKTGGISLSKFYYRRGVRLLPPLFLTVGLLAVYALIVPVWNAPKRIWGDSAAALFYFADYRSAFGHEPWGGYLSQCWSLAVEEQFYLIWAALLLVTLKFGNRKLAYAMAVTGIVLCSANRYRIVLSAAHWNSYVAGRVYYAFDTRADALFLGCLLGLIATGGHLDGWKPWAKRTLTVLALISTGVMIWIIWSVTLAPRSLPLLWLPVSEVASALIIVYFIVQPKGWGTRLMGLSALVFVGNMSYTIYLIHWPIYVAISPYTVRWSYWVMDLARAAIIIPLAIASWYLMEKPLMNWRRRALDPTKPPGGTVPVDGQGLAAAPPASTHIPVPAPVSSAVDLTPVGSQTTES
jgi:peptidoglycan/LPS O-acetylase OafA/YrhL